MTELAQGFEIGARDCGDDRLGVLVLVRDKNRHEIPQIRINPDDELAQRTSNPLGSAPAPRIHTVCTAGKSAAPEEPISTRSYPPALDASMAIFDRFGSGRNPSFEKRDYCGLVGTRGADPLVEVSSRMAGRRANRFAGRGQSPRSNHRTSPIPPRSE